jgi:hypothetical protein
MSEYLIIKKERLEALKVSMSGGADPHPRTPAEGIPFGAVRALRKVPDIAEREMSEEEFDLVIELLDRIAADKGNGGFANAGE